MHIITIAFYLWIVHLWKVKWFSDMECQKRETRLPSIANLREKFASYFNISRERVPRKSDFGKWHGLAERGPFPSWLGYNGWPGEKGELWANLWAALRLFRDLCAEERCIALNKFMARPRLWSMRSSWRAPRRVFRIEILRPSQLSSLLSIGWTGAPCAFTEASIARQDILSIYFLFVKSSFYPLANT